jgi:hypothetical protein
LLQKQIKFTVIIDTKYHQEFNLELCVDIIMLYCMITQA